MSEARTIEVGADKAAEYLAYGDDSQYGDTLAFAFLILRRDNLKRAEQRLDNLKTLFKIPKTTPLHCRVLFNEQARNKAGLSHLRYRDALSIVERGVRIINRVPIILRYGRDSVSRFSNSVGSEIELTDHNNGSKTKLPVNHDPKGLLSLLMQGCFLVPPNGSGGPPASECEIFVAEDATKVRFIGSRRQRAHNLYSGFSDIGAAENEVFQLRPTVLKAADAPMLQLADIAAYLCSHAAPGSSVDPIFQELLGRVIYWWRVGF